MIHNNRTDDHRAQLIHGLRALAAFLETRPDLPVPHDIDVMVSIRHDSAHESMGEVQRIAQILGTPADLDKTSGHSRASLSFGPVCYRAVAISDASRARWTALMSYQDSVRPDTSGEA
ncbi:hypothetical protein JYK22_35110, partial [Nonomuraea sp. RK-328]|nr:hypothetical protein [Nonomuraea sp. RK-328]